MTSRTAGVLGASSMVGQYVIDQLLAAEYNVFAFSRDPSSYLTREGLRWCALSDVEFEDPLSNLSTWICLCPIWSVAEHFELIQRTGARRVVALSSTSRFTKTLDAGSGDPNENALARRLEEGERALLEWAEQNEIEWVILRPTLIYDFVRDKNLTQIAAFIQRYGFFPLLGKAQGRRQPVHALEVAEAILTAMQAQPAANRDYNISGGETMTYREMVERIFRWLGKEPLFVRVPMTGFSIAIYLARAFPRYRHISGSMVQRMNQDMVFDHADATRDFGYSPGNFLLYSNRQRV